MIDFLVTLFFVAAMLCLLALPIVVTLLFTRGYEKAARKKYLVMLVSCLVGFVLCLFLSGRIYDASLTPEQRAALETQPVTVTEQTQSP